MGLARFLADHFGSKISIHPAVHPAACGTGAFEVSLDGTLVHSKLTMGHGKVQTDEELVCGHASFRTICSAHRARLAPLPPLPLLMWLCGPQDRIIGLIEQRTGQ